MVPQGRLGCLCQEFSNPSVGVVFKISSALFGAALLLPKPQNTHVCAPGFPARIFHGRYANHKAFFGADAHCLAPNKWDGIGFGCLLSASGTEKILIQPALTQKLTG